MHYKKLLVIFLCVVTIAGIVDASDTYKLTAQPDEVRDLVLWLDGDDLDGDGTSEGASEAGLISGMVSQWTDKSGQNNHATQGTASYRPGYNTSAVNGKAAVTFNNNGQYLDIDLSAVEHTIFIVTETGPTPIANNFGTLLVMNDGSVGASYPDKRQPMIFLRDTNRLGISYNDSSGVHHSYNFAAFSGFGIVCLRKGETCLQTYLNGQEVYSDSFAQTEVDGIDSIGRNASSGNTYKGSVAEIIIYDRALETFEYEQVGFYLQSKYGLSLGYEEPFMCLSDDERIRLDQAEAAGLVEIEEVVLPDSSNVLEDNDHFGWPVAAMSGSNIVVHCQQSLSHYTADYDPESDTMRTKNSESNGFVVRSTDYGQSWSSPAYIKDLVSTGGGPNAGGMISIGSDDNGYIVLKHTYYPYGGCLWTGNGGSTWSHFNQAFANLTTARGNMGPKIIDHPVFGLMMFSTQNTWPNNAMLCSTNNGQTWTDRYWTSPTNSIPTEPTALAWDNHILLISREFGDMVIEDERYQMLSQHLYTYESGDSFSDVEFVTQRTNIRGNYYSGPREVWAHDTASVSMNPVTGRIEIIDSHRWGGGLGDTGEDEVTDKSTLNIWSIDPDDLLAGATKWRFDGVLLERGLSAHHGLGYIEGLHPGAAVTDTTNDMQHLFVYAGFSDRRAGVYRISRTLDTDRLRQWLLRRYCTIWNFESWSGNEVDDDSGYALEGSVEGTVSSGTGSTDYGSTGVITLDSSSNCITYDDDNDDFFDFHAGDDFTLEAIIKTSANGTIVSKIDSDGVGWSLAVSSGKLVLTVEDESASDSAIGTATITDGTWHHVAGIRENGVLSVYVDYVVDGSGTDDTGSLVNDDDMVVGGMRHQSSEFVGQIDFFRLARRAFCPQEFLMPEDSRGDADFSGEIDGDDLDIVDAYLGKTDSDMGTAIGDFDADGDVDSTDRQYVLDNYYEGSAVLPVTEGLFVHLYGSYVFEDSGDIICWPDTAPLGGSNSAVTAGGNPQSVISDGVYVVEFDGDDYLMIAGNDYFDREDKTWFIVFEPDNTDQTEVLLRSYYDDRGDGIANSMLWGSFLENEHYQSHSRTLAGTIRSASGGTVSADWVLLSAVREDGEVSEYIDGSFINDVQGVTAQPFYHQGTAVGALVTGNSGFSGRIARVLIYDRALSDTERQAIETFLSGNAPLALIDLNLDYKIDLRDVALLAGHWLNDDCSWPFWCERSDVNRDGITNMDDFRILLDNWL